METLEQITISEYVTKDFRTAAVFSKYGIDYCFKGDKTIREVCETKKLSIEILEQEIETILSSKKASTIDFNAWPIDLLAQYIEKKHHLYVNENIPVLIQFLDKAIKTDGVNYPELVTVKNLFTDFATVMTKHIEKEELIVFPFIKRLVHAVITDELIDVSRFNTIENPIKMIKYEHDTDGEGKRFRKIAELSNNYTAPTDASNTVKITFALLQEFEEQLGKHIHLENNILFPKAIQLEKDFSSQF
jgi:regulator of cell morphogenesis and NO signaling